MAQLRAALIGCGNIGGRCDGPDDNRVISHAHAYALHSDIELSCCSDPNEANLTALKQKWGNQIKAYKNAQAMFESEAFEIVSIAAPTEFHAELLELALNKESVKLIICEKPFVSTLGELQHVSQLLVTHPEKRLLLNFQRRYDAGVNTVVDMIKREELGKPLYFNAVYRKGLYHNGCHLLELIDNLFGGLISIKAERQEIVAGDYFGRYYVAASSCDGHIASVETENYWLLDLELFCQKGRVRLADSGHRLELFRPDEWSIYPGVKLLKLDKQIPDSLDRSMEQTLAYGYELLRSKASCENSIFEEHLLLSEKLLLMKEAFGRGESLVNWKNMMEAQCRN